MKKYLIFSLVLVALLTFCKPKEAAEAEPEAEEKLEEIYLLPVPKKVLFYRDGTTVYDAYIPANAVIDNSFILPVNVDRNSFSIYQDGERIFTYSLEEKNVFIQLMEDSPFKPGSPLIENSRALLVTVPELVAGSSPEVRFGIGRSGITWELVLDMEAGPNNTLECNLLASIHAGSSMDRNLEFILAQRPEIVLISSRNVFLEGSDAIFNLGNLELQKYKTTFIRLENGQSRHRLVYRWYGNNQGNPTALLYCTNPFNSSISSIKGNLNSNGLNINTFSNIRLMPGRQIEIPVGDQPLLVTRNSVRIQEFENRPNLPFTHHLEYTVTNQLGLQAEVEVIVPVVFGRVHRTQYRFPVREPDERPGENMLWRYRINPNSTARLEFNFDAESKDNPLYREFSYYANGR